MVCMTVCDTSYSIFKYKVVNICFDFVEVARVRETGIFILLIVMLMLSVTVVAGDEGIALVPSEPMAGKNLIFYIPSINGLANGYVVCKNSSNVHLIEMENGIAQVTLCEDDYGDATVKIFVGNTTYEKSFMIKPFVAGTLIIEAPLSVLIDTDTSIQIVAGASPAAGATVTFTSISDRSFNRVSSEEGAVSFSFDEEGIWKVQAVFYGVTASVTVDVLLPPIEIVFSDNIAVNDEMIISVGCPADITIRKDEITWTYRTDANGDLYFTPPWPGRYNIHAKTEKQEGTKTFTTISETRIDVYDFQTSHPISTIKKDQDIEIVVVDSKGVPISAVQEISVYCDNMFWDAFPLSDGKAVWHVGKAASVYRFEVEETEGYTSSETTLYGAPEESLSGDITSYVVLILIIAVLLALVFYLHRTGRIKLPDIFARRGPHGISLKGKKLE